MVSELVLEHSYKTTVLAGTVATLIMETVIPGLLGSSEKATYLAQNSPSRFPCSSCGRKACLRFEALEPVAYPTVPQVALMLRRQPLQRHSCN